MSARKFWILPAPSGSAIARLSPLILAHEREVFRQRGEHRAQARGLGQEAARRLEIGVDIVAGGHLDCRYAHGSIAQAHIVATTAIAADAAASAEVASRAVPQSQ